jgi:hypothetical protein
MMVLCKNLPLDPHRCDATLDEALKRYPDQYQIELKRAEGLLPKWGGSDEAVHDFIVHVADTAPGGRGDMLYARLYTDIACCDYPGMDLFQRAGAQWPRLRAGLEAIRARYPDAENLNAEAELACRAGDVALLRIVLSRIGDHPILRWWKNRQDYYEACRKRAGSLAPAMT